jgi:DNA repair exonuclease SbcCD ATPase subunit
MPGLFDKIKRVGTTPQKFQFTICVKEISFSKTLSDVCGSDIALEDLSLIYIWKRGPRSAISKPRTCEDPVITKKFSGLDDQHLNLMCTLYQDSKKGSFVEKTSTITLRAASKEFAKEIGVATIDLAKYAGVEHTAEDEVEISKCKDKHAKLKFSLSSKWIKELSGIEHDSASIAEAEDDEESEQREEKDLSNSKHIDRKGSASASKSASPAKAQDGANNHVESPLKSDLTPTVSKKDDAKVAMLQAEMQDLVKNKEKLEKANKDLKAKLQKKEEEFISLGAVQGERDLALNRAAKLQEEVKSLNAELKKAQSHSGGDHKGKSDDWKVKYDQLLEETNRKEEAYMKAESENKKTISKLEDEVSRMTEDEQDYKNDISTLVEEVKKLREELNTKNAELNSQNSFKSKLEAKEQELSKLKALFSSSEESRKAIEAEKLHTEKQRDRCKADLERIQIVLGDWEIKMVNLKVELVNAVDKWNTLEMDNIHLKESVERYANAVASKKK